MKEEVENAVNSAKGNVGLEGYILTPEEEAKVKDSINKSDVAFTDDVLGMINEENKKEDDTSVKIRK